VTGLWNTLTTAAKLLTEVRAGFVVGALGVYLISIGIVAVRWRFILRALGVRVSVWDSFLTYSAGVFMGNVTPARSLGCDACRVGFIRTRSDASIKIATASVLYDRISEAPAVTLVALLGLVALRPSALIAAIVAVFAVLLLAGPVRRGIAAKLTHWHDTLVGVPVGRGTVVAALGCSALIWIQDVTRITLVAAAFGVWLTPPQAAALSGFRLLSGLIPVPGGVGVVEGSYIGGLVLFGVPADMAAAITIVERAILFGVGTCIGAVSLTLVGGRRVLGKRAQAAAATVSLAVLVGVLACAGTAQAQPAVAAVATGGGTASYRAAISSYEASLRADPGNLAMGAAYRQLIISHDDYDRAISFFKTLAKAHRDLANIQLDLGLAYLDKIPTMGRIRQGFLGKDAINAFGDAIAIEPTWLAYFTRGFVDLFYDGMFNRARPAVTDFEQALALQRRGPRRAFHVRTFVLLGDAYWKLKDLARAREAWTDGLKEFPGDAQLAARLAADGRALYTVIESGLDASIRQDTSLKEMIAVP
jgi:glycosyltransferase 2 family protein